MNCVNKKLKCQEDEINERERKKRINRGTEKEIERRKMLKRKREKERGTDVKAGSQRNWVERKKES